jgi:MFS family permease
MHSQPATQAGAVKSPGLVLTALCLASFMATLDLFVVNVALKDIGRDFAGQGLSNLSWILNAYAIIFGALLIPAGRWVVVIAAGVGAVVVLGISPSPCAAAGSPGQEQVGHLTVP